MRRWVLVLLVGCKYGGSEADPYADIVPVETIDGQIDASNVPAEVDAARPPARADAGGSLPTSLDASKPSTSTSCDPKLEVAVCDPVKNTGCPPIPLMQCDADTMAATPTGRCSIFTPTPIVPCSSTTTAASTACLPQTTCVEGVCRKLCYCDADCESGQTCSDNAGAFKLCK